jgi:adenylosuccinate lyase
MIDRFSTPEMQKIWSEREKYRRWLKVEKAVNDALIKNKVIPENNLSHYLEFWSNADGWLTKLIQESTKIEKEIGHDVNAFVFAIDSSSGEDTRWIHYGMTSSDLVDTANAMAVKESLGWISNAAIKLEEVLYRLTKESDGVDIAGRTHGQYAEPYFLNKVFFSFYHALKSTTYAFADVRLPGMISGAVGDNKYISPDIEMEVLDNLGLLPCFSTQAVPRHHHAQLVSRLALIASALESMVLQVRLYQQSGIEEMYEPFGEKQTGSSAMPHKRNPILCENVAGLSRLMRSYVGPALENVSLWGQRDISHSSVERVILPDAFNVLHKMLQRTIYIFENLEINKKAIAKNLLEVPQDSQSRLLELVREGKSRQEAYRIVQGEIK